MHTYEVGNLDAIFCSLLRSAMHAPCLHYSDANFISMNISFCKIVSMHGNRGVCYICFVRSFLAYAVEYVISSVFWDGNRGVKSSTLSEINPSETRITMLIGHSV